MNANDLEEIRARMNIMERAWVELASHFYFFGLINDVKIAEIEDNLSAQTANKMEAVFLYSLMYSFWHTRRMEEHKRGLAEIDAFVAKHGKILP